MTKFFNFRFFIIFIFLFCANICAQNSCSTIQEAQELSAQNICDNSCENNCKSCENNCKIFSKVKIKGVLVGKQEYSKYYAMSPGDTFNIESHEHSIEKLKGVLKSQGYFNSEVSGKINYYTEKVITKSVTKNNNKNNNKTKEPVTFVSVELLLDRKSKFYISGVDFSISNASDKKIEKKDKLKIKINKLFVDKLVKNQYSKALIEREITDLKKYLAKKGFWQVDIELVEKIDYDACNVDLRFILTLHSKKEFVFFGNNFFSSTKLLEKILIYGRSAWLVPGSILSGEMIKDYHDNGFWDVKIDVKEGESGYSFFIKEGDRACIKEVEIIGAKSFSSEFLIKTCFAQLINVKNFDQEILDKSLDDFTNLYLADGFWDIKILKHDFVKIKNSQNIYKLVVAVDEGQKSFLKALSIKWAAKDSGQACENLELILQDGPFKKFSSKLKLENFEPKKLGENCLNCDNNKPVNNKTVNNKSEIDKSVCNKIAFDPGILSEQKDWLLKYFKNKGYLYAEVNLILERDGQNVSVVWEIDLGALVKFGQTNILSSRPINTDFIMRELQYKLGDIWDNNKLKSSVSRLRSLGVFDSVHLYPDKNGENRGKKGALSKTGTVNSFNSGDAGELADSGDSREEQKDILIKINPSDPYEIRTRVGLERYGISKSSIFGQGFTYKLGGAFIFKNPLQNADQLMIDFDLALPYRNAFASYVVPWVCNHKVKTTFKVYANRYEQPGFMCSKTNLYQAKQDGFLVGLNKNYRKLNFDFNTGLEWLETSVKTGKEDLAFQVARAINFNSCLLGKKIPYLWVEPVFLLNTVDDKINPRSGYFTLVSLKGMLPIEKIYMNSFFVKFTAEQSFFKAITSHITGALRLRCGHIFHKSFKDITPIERFYLGGAHSIRSYEKDMCPPWGFFCDSKKAFGDSTIISDSKLLSGKDLGNTDSNNPDIAKSGTCQNSWVIAPQGGRSTISANLEARFDIYKSMSGVIFQDMGSLFDDKLVSDNFSQATGFGLRFNSPVGPVRFDLGFKWKVRNPAESRCAWFLAFGNAF